jgi:hypothetical protein
VEGIQGNISPSTWQIVPAGGSVAFAEVKYCKTTSVVQFEVAAKDVCYQINQLAVRERFRSTYTGRVLRKKSRAGEETCYLLGACYRGNEVYDDMSPLSIRLDDHKLTDGIPDKQDRGTGISTPGSANRILSLHWPRPRRVCEHQLQGG